MGLLPFPTLMVRDVQHVEILSLPKLAIYFRTFEYSGRCRWYFTIWAKCSCFHRCRRHFLPDDILFKYNSVRHPKLKAPWLVIYKRHKSCGDSRHWSRVVCLQSCCREHYVCSSSWKTHSLRTKIRLEQWVCKNPPMQIFGLMGVCFSTDKLQSINRILIRCLKSVICWAEYNCRSAGAQI